MFHHRRDGTTHEQEAAAGANAWRGLARKRVREENLGAADSRVREVAGDLRIRAASSCTAGADCGRPLQADHDAGYRAAALAVEERSASRTPAGVLRVRRTRRSGSVRPAESSKRAPRRSNMKSEAGRPLPEAKAPRPPRRERQRPTRTAPASGCGK